MNRGSDGKRWSTLDRDLRHVSTLEAASHYALRPLATAGLGLVFLALAGLAAALAVGTSPGDLVVITATVFAAYMALNIGANDVANNVGPAVGARALSMTAAIVIAAICESAGALIGGKDVISTVSTGIIDTPGFGQRALHVQALMSAVLGAALWLNLATWIGAPISTTHAVLGALVGAGLASGGVSAVHWDRLAAIAATWVASPLAGAGLAALLLALLERAVVHREDKIAAACTWVPVLTGTMTGVFAFYLLLKGVPGHSERLSGLEFAIGAALGLGAWAASRQLLRRQSAGLENRKRSLKIMFHLPLILSAAILSFAHGANDVANAVGPLVAIVEALAGGHPSAFSIFPLWVVGIGAAGLSAGLALFGPKLVRLVGDEITRLNPLRAACVSLSAGIIVISASWAGMPVSTTHITIGGVFGVGFFREWDHERRMEKVRSPDKRMPVEERTRRRLVRRSHFLTIVAAWIVTVPAAALLAASAFLILSFVSG